MPTTTLQVDEPKSGETDLCRDTETPEAGVRNSTSEIDMPFVPGTVIEETTSGSLERYDWNACSIQVAITIHPDDGHSQGRLVTIAAWTHGDAPVTRTLRRDEIGHFPPAMRDALVALRAEFPLRERIAFERQRATAEKAIKDDAQRREAAARRTKPTTKLEKRIHDTSAKPVTAKATASATPGRDVPQHWTRRRMLHQRRHLARYGEGQRAHEAPRSGRRGTQSGSAGPLSPRQPMAKCPSPSPLAMAR